MITSKVLTELGVSHNIIVEPQEVDKYQKSVKTMGLFAKIIPLDMTYKNKYELCDSLGLSKSTGSGPARNFGGDCSRNDGFSHHWIIDDNIRSFRRLNNNEKIKVSNGAIFRAMEDFCLRYENISMAGPNYSFFAWQKKNLPPFLVNTKIYSCNLIRNDVSFRWRGRYNEDVILTLDMLKAGWCTVLFYAFLQDKMQTQQLKGGNTDELYHGSEKQAGKVYSQTGTLDKSKMLATVHPDVARVTYRFKRIHHYVDYSVFKTKLIKKKNLIIDTSINDYGMKLKQL